MGICSTRSKREKLDNAPISFWNIEASEAGGNKISMSHFKDKKALIVIYIKDANSIKKSQTWNQLYERYKYKYYFIKLTLLEIEDLKYWFFQQKNLRI